MWQIAACGFLFYAVLFLFCVELFEIIFGRCYYLIKEAAKLAVEEFQDDTGIVGSDDTNYGKVNDATWGKMAEVLYVPSSGNPTLFRMNGRTAITAKYSGGVYNFYYHNTDGTEGSKFASVY